MATWQADCWLGPSSGRQKLQVQSNTSNGAKEQLQRIYGAQNIANLRKVSGSDSMISMDDDGATATAKALQNIFDLVGAVSFFALKAIGGKIMRNYDRAKRDLN